MVLSPTPLLFLGPTIPGWILDGVILVILLVTLGAIVSGGILEYRYTSPYTLLTASSKQKWQWAAIIIFSYTIALPLLGLIDPLLNISDPRHWSGFPIFCSGLWVVIFPIAVLFKRWKIERQLKSYQKMDKMIKSGFYQQLASSPLTGWSFRLMNLFNNTERKRFFEEGYPQEGELDEEAASIAPSWLIKLVDNTKSISRWFARRYPDENILFATMAILLEVGKESPISWLPSLYQRRGVAIITEEFLFFKSKFLSLAVFISVAITLTPLTVAIGFLYLIYFLYSGASFISPLVLISFIILLIPVLLLLMATFAFGLSIFQYRPHQEQIPFHDIQNVDVETVSGVMRRYPSLTLTTTNKTFNVVFAKTLPDEIIRIISRDKLQKSN